MGEGPKDVTSETGQSTAAGSSPDTSTIRAEIEQTRADISGTLDEIQERLTPRNLVSQATDSVRDATSSRLRQVRGAASGVANRVASTTRRAATRTAEHAREHPWPAAAAAAGVGFAAWWLASRRSRFEDADWDVETDLSEESLYFDDELTLSGHELPNGSGMGAATIPVVLAGALAGWWLWRRQSPSRSLPHPEGEDTSWNGGAYGSAGADAGSYRTFEEDRRWKNEGFEARGRVRDMFSDAASRARHAAAAAGERTRDAATRAQQQLTDGSRRAMTQVERWIEENPLGAGAAALLAGFLIGMAVPESERERRMLGGARRRLIDSAQRAGRDAVGRARQTLVDAANDRRRA